MRSRVFSSKFIKNNLSGGFWVPMLLGIGFFFAFPVDMLMTMGTWAFNRTPNIAQFMRLTEKLYEWDLARSGGLIILIAAFLNAMVGFFYLYSRDQVDFYHSLPISRRHMFLQKLISGLYYTSIPYVLMWFLSLLVAAVRGYFHFEVLLLALEMMARHLITYLFLYFCFVLIFTVTGNVLMGVLSIFGLTLYGPAVYYVLNGYQEYFFNNYSSVGSNFMEKIIKFTPYAIYRYLCSYPPETAVYVYAVFFTLLLGVLSYFAYLKRPSEATGKSVVYEWFAQILKYLVVILMGLMFGLVLYSFQTSAQIYWGIFGLITGTILMKGFMEVLYSFDFRSFFKHNLQTLLSLAAVFAIAAVLVLDVFNYAGYFPTYEKLESIGLQLGDDFNGYYISVDENGAVECYSPYDIYSTLGNIRKNDNEVGEKFYQAMKTIVEHSQLPDEMADENSYRYPSIHVKYNLKSGGYANRAYRVSSADMKNLLLALYEDTNFKEYQLSGLQVDAAEYLDEITGLFYDQEYYTLFANMPEKKQALVDALIADYTEATPEELVNQKAVVRLEFSYPYVPSAKEYEYDYNVYVENPSTSIYRQYLIYPSFKRTMALLQETGFPLSGEELEYKKAEIVVCNSEKDVYFTYDPVEITDEKDLKEITEKMIHIGNRWTPEMENVYVDLCTDDDPEFGCISYNFLKDDVPACVQKVLDQIEAGEIHPATETPNDISSYESIQIDPKKEPLNPASIG